MIHSKFTGMAAALRRRRSSTRPGFAEGGQHGCRGDSEAKQRGSFKPPQTRNSGHSESGSYGRKSRPKSRVVWAAVTRTDRRATVTATVTVWPTRMRSPGPGPGIHGSDSESRLGAAAG
jgi:hypothetical protein